MKLKLFLLAGLSVVIAASCSKFDDLQAQIDEQGSRITRLEVLCNEINTKVTELTALTAAIEGRDYIKKVESVSEGGVVTGYKITFGKADAITIPIGKNGKDGKDGKDGVSPSLTIKEDGGRWYWFLNGAFLTDGAGNKLAVEGITPKFKIENNRWFTSYDNGKTWNEVGPSASEPLINNISLTDDSVTFVLADGKSVTLALNLEYNFNIPYGIVMLTSDLGEMLKGEVATMRVVVNPSNFPITVENAGVYAVQDVYSCIEEDGIVRSGYKIVDVEKVEGQEGTYDLSVMVDGMGSYYDDATLFASVKGKDSDGVERSTCSSSGCTVKVVPNLAEAIYVDSPVQSFYKRNLLSLPSTNVKDFYVGLWSKTYVNNNGVERVYDRSNVSVSAISDSTSTLESKYFADYGFVTVTPDTDAEFWKNAVEMKDTQKSVSVEGATISLTKSGAKGEIADLEFNYKYFFAMDTTDNKSFSVTKDSLSTAAFTLDYTDFHAATGLDEFVQPRFTSKNVTGVNTLCVFSRATNKPGFQFTLTFRFNKPMMGKIAYANYYEIYTLAKGQGKDGKSVDLPEDLDYTLISLSIRNIYPELW